jgi:transposase
MRKLTIINPEESKTIIQEEIHRTDEGRLQHRLHCMLLICDGKTCAEVAALFGDSIRATQYWIKRFNELGIPGLGDLSRPGRRGRLSSTEKEALVQDLHQNPRVLGYSQNLWDGKLLSHHIQKKFNIELKVRQCQNLFHKFDFRRRKPRPVIAKGDSKAQEGFKKNA